jgi:hypothetical protein
MVPKISSIICWGTMDPIGLCNLGSTLALIPWVKWTLFGLNLDLNSLCKTSFNNKAYFTLRVWAKVESKWINPIGVVNEINPRILQYE